MIDLKENERLDDLVYKGLKIIQNTEEYNFTSDAVLLANFVKIKSNEKTLELCSGSGVIGILASAKNNVKEMYLVEIQKNMAEMSKRSIELNNMQNSIKVIYADMQNLTEYFEKNSFSYCFANPPYKKVDAHKLSGKENIDCSKYETKMTLQTLVKTAGDMLKYGGKFAVIYETERLAEMFSELKKNNLEPKKLQFVHPKNSLTSNVFLLEATKFGKSGLKVLPPIILNDGKFNPQTIDGKNFIKTE